MVKVDMEKKYHLTITIVIFIFIILAIVTVCTHNVNKNKTEETINIVLNEGKLIINYIDGDSVYINDKKSHVYNISITNTDEEKAYYSLEMLNITGDKMNLKLYDEAENELANIDDLASNPKIISLQTIEPQETIRYKLEFSAQKKSQFSGTIRVINDSITTQTFSDLILLNNSITVAKTEVGKEIATTNEGLLTSVDEDGISYYFRGHVENNYVKIDNLYFRIVRINGNGSVRLVLDNVLQTPIPYNSNTLESTAESGSLASLKSASILTTLNEWFNSNLNNYAGNFINNKFCGEAKFPNLNDGLNRSNAYNRAFVDDTPSLICTGEIYEGKVGLLSVDEVTLAGAYRNTENKDYYLYNEQITGPSFLSSPNFISSSNDISMLTLAPNGAIAGGTLITDNAYVRPVINLDISAKVKGEGTYENPYIIVS